MKITATLETGVDYYWKRSEGWRGLSGQPDCHWEYYVEFSGFNGAGGAWIVEKTRHHGCRWYPPSKVSSGGEWFCRQPRTLSAYDTWKLIREIHAIAADRADSARMAEREREKHKARDHDWESWQLHRPNWFPSKWGIA
jgi:hypothetical protein